MKYDTNDSLKVPEKNNRKLGGAIYEIDIKSVKVKKKIKIQYYIDLPVHSFL